MEFPASEASEGPITRSRTRGEPAFPSANGVPTMSPEFALPMPLLPTVPPSPGILRMPLPPPPGPPVAASGGVSSYEPPPIPPPAFGAGGGRSRRSPPTDAMHYSSVSVAEFDDCEDKRKARLEKNRKSAQLSRQRKKRKFEELEFSVAHLKGDKAQLANELASAEEEIDFLRSIISECRTCSAQVSRSSFASTRLASAGHSSSYSREPSRHSKMDPHHSRRHAPHPERDRDRRPRDEDTPGTPDHGGSSSSHSQPPPPGAGPPPLSLSGSLLPTPPTTPGGGGGGGGGSEGGGAVAARHSRSPYHRSSFRSSRDDGGSKRLRRHRSRSRSDSRSRSPQHVAWRRNGRHDTYDRYEPEKNGARSPRRHYTARFYKVEGGSSPRRSRGRGRHMIIASSRSRSRSPLGYRDGPDHMNGYNRLRCNANRHHLPPLPPMPSLAQLLPSPDVPSTSTTAARTNVPDDSDVMSHKTDQLPRHGPKIKTEVPANESIGSSGSSPVNSPSSPSRPTAGLSLLVKVTPPPAEKSPPLDFFPSPPSGPMHPPKTQSSIGRLKARRTLNEQDIAQAAVLLSFKSGKST